MEFQRAYALWDTNAANAPRLSGGDGSPNRRSRRLSNPFDDTSRCYFLPGMAFVSEKWRHGALSRARDDVARSKPGRRRLPVAERGRCR